MSKRRKSTVGQEQRQAVSSDKSSQSEIALGNRAVAEQLSGGSTETRELAFDTIREVAFPLLARASLALHLEPRPAEEFQHLVAILERSHFGLAQRDALIDRLEGDQAAAVAVSETLERTIGEVDDALRSGLIEVLDRAFSVLDEGQSTEGVLAHGDSEIALTEPEGSAADRAGALIADLVEGLASDELKAGLDEVGSSSENVARFCRSVVLAKAFDEEEEEEFGVAPAPEEG